MGLKEKVYKSVCIALSIFCLLCVFPQTALAAIYPSEILETIENGYYKVTKIYALSEKDNPEEIPKTSFEKDGMQYIFTDIVKKETQTEDRKEQIETITLETATSDISEILSQLEQTKEYDSEGYKGILTLDLTSLKTKQAGQKTSSYTVNKTREYPHLSAPDVSLVPKSITENGKTYNLTDVNFVNQSIQSIDYTEVAVSYKAIANYSGTASSTKVTGYVTTVDYKGEIVKTVTDKIYYTAVFTGEKMIVPEPEPEIPPELESKPPISINLYFAVLFIILGCLIGGMGTVIYFLLSPNTNVFNYKDGKYIKIGNININAKSRTADLNKFKKKVSSKKFILELSNKAYNKLKSKEISVLFGDKEIKHTVDPYSDMKKYQFEADFENIGKTFDNMICSIIKHSDGEYTLWHISGIDDYYMQTTKPILSGALDIVMDYAVKEENSENVLTLLVYDNNSMYSLYSMAIDKDFRPKYLDNGYSIKGTRKEITDEIQNQIFIDESHIERFKKSIKINS